MQLLPGEGDIGAALVADPRIRGVIFTGSVEVARLIQKQLARRLTPEGRPIPLIAETGGMNAMIVDSSALPEQVVADVLVSAFDSAGQRCSALRILCLQEEIADRVLAMLDGAMRELAVGCPDRLSVDVGPVISETARQTIQAHIDSARNRGFRVRQIELPAEASHGTFIAPTVIELAAVSDLEREIFGPVLHVVRYRRERLAELVQEINASGYGLTFGVHSRIDETIASVTEAISAGNIYVNRNTIGAVVGVQPFGGHGLSGTGPKAGGPLYLKRLLSSCPAVEAPHSKGRAASVVEEYAAWLLANGHAAEAERSREYLRRSPVALALELPGPVGEKNVYMLRERGIIRCIPSTKAGLFLQLGAAFSTGNRVTVEVPADMSGIIDAMPAGLREYVVSLSGARPPHDMEAVLFEGDGDALVRYMEQVADGEGPVIPVFGVTSDALLSGRDDYPLDWLVAERSISINTAAAGGNASLMSIG